MKEFIFENEIMKFLAPALSEILRYLVWLPLIVLIIRWGYIVMAKRESKKLIRAHIGKVKNHARKTSAAILGLVPPFLQSPIPIIAQVFA